MPTARGGKLPSEITQKDIEKYSSPAVVESYKRGVSSGRTGGLTQAQIQQANEAIARDKAAKELAAKQEAQKQQVAIEAAETEARRQAYFKTLDEARAAKGLPPTGLVKTDATPQIQIIEGGTLPDVKDRGAASIGRREVYDSSVGGLVSVGGEGTKVITRQPTSATITPSGGLSVPTGAGSARQISESISRDEKIDRVGDIITQFPSTFSGGSLDKPLSLETQKYISEKPIRGIYPSTTVKILKEERQAKEDAKKINALNTNLERLQKRYESGEISYEMYSSSYEGYLERNADIIERARVQGYSSSARQVVAGSDLSSFERGAISAGISGTQLIPYASPVLRIGLGGSQALGGIRKVGVGEQGGVTDILAGSLIAGTGFVKPGFNVAATAPSRIGTAAKVIGGAGVIGGLGFVEGKSVYERTGDLATGIGAGVGTSAGIVGLGIYESKRLNPYKKDLQKLKADKPIGESGYFQSKDGKLEYISTSTRKGKKLFSQTTLRFDVKQQGDDLVLIGNGKGTVTFSDLKSGKSLYTKDFGFGGTAQTGGKAIKVSIRDIKGIKVDGKKFNTKFIQDKPLDAIVGRGRVTLDFGDDIISKKFSTLSFDEGKYTLSAADDLLRGYVRPTGEKINLKDYRVAKGKISLDKLTTPKTKFSPKSFTRAGQLTKAQLNIMTGKDGASLTKLTTKGIGGYIPSSRTYKISGTSFSDDVVFYHGTANKNIQNILKKGLLPTKLPFGKEGFLTTSKRLAATYSETGDILKVTLPKKDVSKLFDYGTTKFRTKTGKVYGFYSPISPARITLVPKVPKPNIAATSGFSAGVESVSISSLRTVPSTTISPAVSALGQKTILLEKPVEISSKRQEITSINDISSIQEIGTISTNKPVKVSRSYSSSRDVGKIQSPIQLPATYQIQERQKETQKIFKPSVAVGGLLPTLTNKLPAVAVGGIVIPKSKPLIERKGGRFGVQIRRFGEFRNIGTFSSVEKALARGKEVTGGTLAATFRVTGATWLPKAIKGYKTKRTSKGTEFIEKKELRLSKIGEVEEIKLFPTKKKKTKKRAKKKK